MGTGIIICGLNGAGKSTLGKALAKELKFYFIDNEDLYFPKDNPQYIYASPRRRDEVEKLLLNEIKTHENFIFASVKGDYGENIYPFYQYASLPDRHTCLDAKRFGNIICGEYDTVSVLLASANGNRLVADLGVSLHFYRTVETVKVYVKYISSHTVHLQTNDTLANNRIIERAFYVCKW